jgi:small subunit ribosomal protein S2
LKKYLIVLKHKDMDIQNIIDNKLYVGTLRKYANPKTKKYWAGIINDVVVINPEYIQKQLEKAREKVQNYLNEGKEILVLHDKLLFKEDVEDICSKKGIHYFSYKVPSGVITNFETLLQNIKKMNELRKFIESEDFEKLTKKERLVKMRQLKKMEFIYKGVKDLERKPDLVIIIDGQYLEKFVHEVELTGLDNIVIANTNFNRWWNEDNLILANTNSYKSLKFILSYLLS